MYYLGGKSRTAKKLAPVVLELVGKRILVEPFCGGLSMTEQLHPTLSSDVSVPLVSLVQAVRSGWDPPSDVSEIEYSKARMLPETHPLHGFCGFGCSFGGKLWGGYARPNAKNPNYASASRRSLIRKVQNTRSTEFQCCSYDTLDGNHHTAFYCDPPYANTTRYAVSFNHDVFWIWCRKQTSRGALVLVSEYNVPAGVPVRVVSRIDSRTEMLTTRRSRNSTELLLQVYE